MALVGFTIIRNNFKYDYMLEEAVGSVLPVVDRHIIVECFSEDETYELVLEMQRQNPKIMILRHSWGDRWTILQEVANYAISHIQPWDWFFQIQADEVMHEDSLKLLAALPRAMQDVRATVATFHYTHFVANYGTEFDFMYRRKKVFAQQGNRWTWDGDACQLMNGIGVAADAAVEVYHYGKVHEAGVALLKETDFQELYRDAGLGFPDPKLEEMREAVGQVDYFYLFRVAFQAGQVREFTGSHPKIMEARIAKAKEDGWEQFRGLMHPSKEDS